MNLVEAFEDWSKLDKEETLKALLGDKLGEGTARKVFAMAFNPDLVVKLETRAQSFQNVLEWEVWEDAQNHGKWSRWFAPCQAISPCGLVLIQKRARPLPEGYRPPRLPSFLCDLKPSNFGMIGKQVVAIDYGFHNFFRNGLRQARMRATNQKWRATS